MAGQPQQATVIPWCLAEGGTEINVLWKDKVTVIKRVQEPGLHTTADVDGP